tara:strand:- start:20082 stop:20432 length:351 start_codon:yes stop_codon:yes gene_type:complete
MGVYMAKKRGVQRDQEEVFLSELSRHGSTRKACAVAGLSRTWLRAKKLDEEFLEKYTDALEDSTDRLEETAYSRARAGDDKLIRYLLDARRYKKDRTVDLGEVTPQINITIGGQNA